MIDSELTLGDLRCLRDLHQVLGDQSMKYPELQKLLREKGHPVPGDLSRWLATTETALGGERGLILERQHTGSRLTLEGKAICAALVAVLHQLDSDVSQHATSQSNRLYVGLTNSLTSNLLPRVLTEDAEFSEYLRKHPTLYLRVIEGEEDELERHVETGYVDLAIGPTAPSGDAKRLPFHQLRPVLVFNPSKPKMAKLVPFADSPTLPKPELQRFKNCLADLSVIIPPRHVMPKLEKGFLPKPVEGRRIKLPQASLRRAWAKMGIGAAFTHEELFIKQSPEEQNDLLSIDMSEHLDSTKLWFYFKNDKSLSEPARELMKAIQRVFPEESGSNLTPATSR